MGDPAGIGPDCVLAAWSSRREAGIAPFFVIGDPDVFAARARTLGLDAPLVTVDDTREVADRFEGALPLVTLPVAAPVVQGRPDAANAAAVIGAVETGVTLVHAGAASALVTSPINKAILYQSGFTYPGHTEFLAVLAERHWRKPCRAVMMLAADELRVVPVTIHIPLAEVLTTLSSALIVATVEITARSLTEDFGIARPRIAVAGLNPHAGESGTIGLEERDMIAPAVELLRNKGLRVGGPYPADALFHGAAREGYDAAVAMYHDQALIPIKTLAFERAVNLTLGLPFVRTSPDHGTAYDRAGTGTADPTSLIEALKLAGTVARRRQGAA